MEKASSDTEHEDAAAPATTHDGEFSASHAVLTEPGRDKDFSTLISERLTTAAMHRIFLLSASGPRSGED